MLILITAKWPLDSNNNLLEWPEIIKGNWVALISLLCIIWGGFHYARFSYKLTYEHSHATMPSPFAAALKQYYIMLYRKNNRINLLLRLSALILS